jgi:hypothetical protein
MIPQHALRQLSKTDLVKPFCCVLAVPATEPTRKAISGGYAGPAKRIEFLFNLVLNAMSCA